MSKSFICDHKLNCSIIDVFSSSDSSSIFTLPVKCGDEKESEQQRVVVLLLFSIEAHLLHFIGYIVVLKRLESRVGLPQIQEVGGF
ncbi:hypothetical protein P3S67_029569 [Capsicum chacoense]